MRKVDGFIVLESATDALVETKKLTDSSKERMLLDLVWHVWNMGREGRQQVVKSFTNSSILDKNKAEGR